MKYALPRWLVLVCIAWILCVLCLCTVILLEINAWKLLSQQLDIEPTHAGLDAYLHTVIRPGMSIEQVHRQLDLIAPTVIRPLATGRFATCEEIFFSIGPLPIWEPGYDACYDLNGELVKFSTVY